jgi:hypothetical protein
LSLCLLPPTLLLCWYFCTVYVCILSYIHTYLERARHHFVVYMGVHSHGPILVKLYCMSYSSSVLLCMGWRLICITPPLPPFQGDALFFSLSEWSLFFFLLCL